MWSSKKEIDIENENGYQTPVRNSNQKAFIPKLKLPMQRMKIRTESFNTRLTLQKFNKKYSQKIDLNGSETDEAEKELFLMDTDRDKDSMDIPQTVVQEKVTNSFEIHQIELEKNSKKLPEEIEEKENDPRINTSPKKKSENHLKLDIFSLYTNPKNNEKQLSSDSSSISEKIEESIAEEIATESSSSTPDNPNKQNNISFNETREIQRQESIVDLEDYSDDFDPSDTVKENIENIETSSEISVKTVSSVKKYDSEKFHENILTIDDILQHFKTPSSNPSIIIENDQKENQNQMDIPIYENKSSNEKSSDSFSPKSPMIILDSDKRSQSTSHKSSNKIIKIETSHTSSQTEKTSDHLASSKIRMIEILSAEIDSSLKFSEPILEKSLSSRNRTKNESERQLKSDENKKDYLNDFELETSIEENLEERKSEKESSRDNYLTSKSNINSIRSQSRKSSSEQSSSWIESISIKSDRRHLKKEKIKKRNVGVQCDLQSSPIKRRHPAPKHKETHQSRFKERIILSSKKHPRDIEIANPSKQTPPYIQSPFWMKEITSNVSQLPGEQLKMLILNKLGK